MIISRRYTSISEIRKQTTWRRPIEELGDDYTDEEIRLVRIKFISEMAN